jgi:hypothetical protein
MPPPFGSVEEVGRRWGHCARDAGWGLNTQIHAIGDGADWIRLQSKEVFRQPGTFLCDFYHVSQYLGAAAPSCAPTPGEEPNSKDCDGERSLWSWQRWRSIWNQKARPMKTPLCERGLDYPRAIALGLPIGSGMFESGHRHVLHSRLKNAGAAWLQNTADQIAHLRVLRANSQWQSLWN